MFSFYTFFIECFRTPFDCQIVIFMRFSETNQPNWLGMNDFDLQYRSIIKSIQRHRIFKSIDPAIHACRGNMNEWNIVA